MFLNKFIESRGNEKVIFLLYIYITSLIFNNSSDDVEDQLITLHKL